MYLFCTDATRGGEFAPHLCGELNRNPSLPLDKQLLSHFPLFRPKRNKLFVNVRIGLFSWPSARGRRRVRRPRTPRPDLLDNRAPRQRPRELWLRWRQSRRCHAAHRVPSAQNFLGNPTGRRQPGPVYSALVHLAWTSSTNVPLVDVEDRHIVFGLFLPTTIPEMSQLGSCGSNFNHQILNTKTSFRVEELMLFYRNTGHTTIRRLGNDMG